MIVCPRCGRENVPGMAYCEQCGGPLAAPNTTGSGEESLATPLATTVESAPTTTSEETSTSEETVSAPDSVDGDVRPRDSSSKEPVLTFTFPSGQTFTMQGSEAQVGRADIAQGWQPDLDVVPYGGGALDLGVSRHHARLLSDVEDGFSVVDLGSTNGTWVNGRAAPYNSPVPLRDGDTLAFGAFRVTVTVLS